jgi:hypothetical protein
VARQRSDVRLAIGTALFAGNQDRREILGYGIAGYPVQHLNRIRRYTRQTPKHGPPATRETGDSTAPQKMMAAPEQAGKTTHAERGCRRRPRLCTDMHNLPRFSRRAYFASGNCCATYSYR